MRSIGNESTYFEITCGVLKIPAPIVIPTNSHTASVRPSDFLSVDILR